MHATWKQLAFLPSAEVLAALRREWHWLIGDDLAPFLCSASGDVFFEALDGTVFWLDAGNGRLSQVAPDRVQFEARVRSDGGAELLLSPVIDALFAAGVTLGPEQCFGYKIFPVLGGRYDAGNMVATSAASWYGFSGHVHEQMKDLPDGTVVNFVFDPAGRET